MFIFNSFRFLFVALISLVIFFAGCNKHNYIDTPVQEGDATLSLHLSVPAGGANVKSISGNPSDPDTWSAWERVVDGRYLYRVTAFLLDGNRLVAKEDISLSGEPDKTSLTFNGNFTHGTYKLIIVANYSQHTANDGANGDKTYNGIDNFSTTVESILKTSGTIENFTSAYETSFFKYKILSDEGICKRVPQPLTLVKDIELHPGANEIEGELLRSYSRIRIVVENQSDEQLNIQSLEFCNLFTQTESYIFENVGYISSKRAMNVAHSNAITPFVATSSNPLKINGKESCVVFDTYILESKLNSGESGYSYSLGLGYGDTEKYIIKSASAINSLSSVSKGYYIIYNARRGRVLKVGSSKVEAAQIGQLQQGGEIAKEYVWAFDNTGLQANQYYIGTPEVLQDGDQTAYYMGSTTTDNVSLSSKLSTAYNFTLSTFRYNNSNYIAIRSSQNNGQQLYLQMPDNTKVNGTKDTGNSTRFYLYPVERSGATRHQIPLETIDNITGQASEVTEIKRNDFVNTIVSVKYNKNAGHFTFEVKDWQSAGGDINFN